VFVASVRQALARWAGEVPELAVLERTEPGRRSSYRVEVLTVHLAGGRRERIFVKDFGVCRHEKPGMEERRGRELCVYRDLLAGLDVGTPAFRGSVWDESRGRFWLLLEYVEGPTLKKQPFEYWVAAARWLGHAHGRLAGHDLTSCDYLVAHDAAFFARVAEDALRALRAVSPSLAGRLRRALTSYADLVQCMAAGPLTLVHGVFRPQNILIRAAPDAPHVCVTDWEEAARGSPLYDLAQLSDGFDPPRLHALLDGYDEERGRAGLAAPDRADAVALLRCLWIHRNLKTLTKVDARPGDFTREGIAGLVERTEALARRIP
jgi:aminoglycoside phosphotransferase (APT) family kinase protein